MHWTYKQNARTVCPLLCILFSATMCLGVYFEFPFLWVGSVYLWAFMLLADRLSVVVAAVPSRLVRRYGSPSLLLSLPLIPMWRWPDDVDFHILKMVIVSVKIDCLFFFFFAWSHVSYMDGGNTCESIYKYLKESLLSSNVIFSPLELLIGFLTRSLFFWSIRQ